MVKTEREGNLEHAHQVYYNNGPGKRNELALVYRKLEDGHADLLVFDENGGSGMFRDVPHAEPDEYAGIGDGSGGASFHHHFDENLT